MLTPCETGLPPEAGDAKGEADAAASTDEFSACCGAFAGGEAPPQLQDEMPPSVMQVTVYSPDVYVLTCGPGDEAPPGALEPTSEDAGCAALTEVGT